jgi:hypothetical protein
MGKLGCNPRCQGGFDEHWRMWVSKLLSTSKTIVVLNEVSGRWLMCHWGLY